MPRHKKNAAIPRFESEEEELRFWDTHDWEDYDDGPATDIILALKPTPKTRVTMWLDTPVVEALKRIARRHKMGYQTLARGLLGRSVARLEREDDAGGRRGRTALSAGPRARSAKRGVPRKSQGRAK